MNYNFAEKKWEIMKLRFDPRTKKEGLAVYKNKEDAEYTKLITLALSGNCIKTKILIK